MISLQSSYLCENNTSEYLSVFLFPQTDSLGDIFVKGAIQYAKGDVILCFQIIYKTFL